MNYQYRVIDKKTGLSVRNRPWMRVGDMRQYLKHQTAERLAFLEVVEESVRIVCRQSAVDFMLRRPLVKVQNSSRHTIATGGFNAGASELSIEQGQPINRGNQGA